MSDDQMRFFDTVFGDTPGLMDLVTWDDSKEPTIQRWVNWPEDRDFVERYVYELHANDEYKMDVYVATSLFTGKERTQADSGAHTRVVGVDADTCHPDNFRIPPSIVVETSPGRWHCWWVLDEDVPSLEATNAAKRIATVHESQGCDKPSTHIVSKILRVPGTWNNGQHTAGPFQVTASYSGEVFPLDTINAVYADAAIGSDVARQEATTTADFDESLFDSTQMDRLAEYAKVSWEKDVATLEREMVPGSWHTTGYRIACNMFRNANVVWSEYTHADVEETVTRIAEVDSSESQADLDRIFRDARKEVGNDSLAMPAWALDLLPDLPPDQFPKKDLPDLEDLVKAAGLTDVYTKSLGANETSTHRTHELAKGLFRAGASARQVYTLAMHSTANAFKNKRPGSAVWADVQWAMAAAEMPDETDEANGRDVKFLTDEERAYVLNNPCFIDKYVAWVANRTDAAEVYNRSIAWMVLSAIYADKGTLPLKWGNTPLNLWMLILGDTTETRKSTATAFGLKVIHRFEEITDTKIDIGSDTTAEGLKMVLAERDGLTSLINTDEVNGFFHSIITKNYQAGIRETFTKLYDGTVEATLRATKGSGNANRASTQFLFLGVGIRRQTAEILTKRDFESGFLARMLWAVADPPPWRPHSEDMAFADGESSHRDVVLDGLLDDLLASSSRLSNENRVEVKMSPEVLSRFNEFVDKGHGIARKFGDGDVLKPSFARMKVSVMKAAALLALHEGYHEVEMRHALIAIEQGEKWFRDMVRMAGEVSSSEYERRLDEVESFIACGPDRKRTDQSIRKQFSKFRPQEMNDILQSLNSQGRVRKTPDDSKKWEVLA